MRNRFPLFQSHLDVAQAYWQKLVQTDDLVIDATCGNGKDTAFLAQLPCSKIYAIDKQAQALAHAKEFCKKNLSVELFEKVCFIEGCHSRFPEEIIPGSVKLVVYNLGYLPGGDKSITTFTPTTLSSIQNALKLIVPGGAISITCYPGHSEGKEEEDQILEMTAKLLPTEWSCCHHVWHNRQDAPSLLLIQHCL